ncbi:PQQ-binding-like beta-propeller repeat protein [Telmatocola sphagniphila]|uniref:PQQ-binding-like beta-propeller repeat protein n=1 Tax=Telmatocola sphagniphila TaxID=1123043 RepID=A0A8E6EUV6_9BACT|nr:PQQ-binding-like beta-propeller repeat protein [Telmatocola sphagniphila]QVL31900.1 PQQ-binding-like beta-propeller repeat protein [Telmatocola sphagniphila]
MSILSLCAYLALATASLNVSEENWPQWRGPSGNSVTTGPALPTKWSKTENVLWKTALPGWGNSTPAIWNDHIFLTTQEKDKLLLLCLSKQTGQILWQKEVSSGSPRRSGELGNDRFHDEQNMASPSPVTDGQHVWVHFGNGELACYNFAGEKIWSDNQVKKFGPYTIWWGHANSPVLFEDLLITTCMQDPKNSGKSYVLAQDKRTGSEKWKVERITGAVSEPADSYTTPLIYTHDGKSELIVFGGNQLDAYNPRTGEQLWKCNCFKGNRVISGPTLANDTVYAVQGMRGPLFAVKATGQGDVTATNILWKYTGGTPDSACPLYTKGLIFLANNDGVAVCIDAATGKELWKERLGQSFRSSPLASGDLVYFFSKEGKAFVVEAAREFKLIYKTDMGEEILASPAAVSGSLFIRTREHLYRIGSK